MNARRLLTAGAVIVAAAASTGCAGANPALSQGEDEEKMLPMAPPVDTAGFIPPESVP